MRIIKENDKKSTTTKSDAIRLMSRA